MSAASTPIASAIPNDPAATPLAAESGGDSHAATTATSIPVESTDRHLRTTFLSKVAHDIRSPTGVATGALNELENALGQSAAEHKIWLTMLRRGMKRLLRLADHLSMAAELEERPLDLARTHLDVAKVARAAVNVATFVQSRSAVKLETDLPEGTAFASVDARWLEPAICDLVCNAIRFAYRRARVSLAVTDAQVRLIVEDDGAGVSPDALATLFVRFAPRSSGVGLSVPIAHAVVEGHGGRLGIEQSTLPAGRGDARGARIVIELPRA